jgi:hypothetical protein
MNGFSTLMANLIGAVAYIIIYGPQNFTFLYDRFVGFATAGLIISIFQAVFVYARSFRKGALLALGGNSGNIIYDVSPPATEVISTDVVPSSTSDASSTQVLAHSTSRVSTSFVPGCNYGRSSTSAACVTRL